ncbi:MAG: hypothetical protein AAF682_22025 [Planctomycetota bacterium]
MKNTASRRAFAPLLVLALVSTPGAAQEPWELGPYQTGLRPLVYYTPESSSALYGAVYGRTVYPALGSGLDAAPDLSGGPYPHIAFFHGWTVDTTHYTEIMHHLASWGFVVTGCDTNVGHDEPALSAGFANDQRLLMEFLEAESAAPGAFLEGMFDFGDWGAVGHSFGASTSLTFSDVAPRLVALVAHQPYMGPDFGGTEPADTQIADFAGGLAVVAGSVDVVTPAFLQNYVWYDAATSASTRLFALVDGMGHTGAVDFTAQGEPMSADEQERVTWLFSTAFLQAEMHGESALYDQLAGEAALAEPWTIESGGTVPAFWALDSVTQPDALAYGIAGDYGASALIAISPAPAAVPSAFGLIEVDLTLSTLLWSGALDAGTGIEELFAPIPPSASGVDFYLQALQLDGAGGGAVSPLVTWTAP